ncbi:hypothetical protein LC612_35815 [Nostoc sp. CHAB 5834]|nr:hypothetical protein [Nostoc sp. CHAB 5834]
MNTQQTELALSSVKVLSSLVNDTSVSDEAFRKMAQAVLSTTSLEGGATPSGDFGSRYALQTDNGMAQR